MTKESYYSKIAEDLERYEKEGIEPDFGKTDEDFTGTEARSPSDALLWFILKDRKDVQSILHQYRLKCLYSNRSMPRLETEVKGAIAKLYSQIRAAMQEEEGRKDSDFYEIERLMRNTKDVNGYIKANDLIEIWMRRKGITKFDNIQRINQYSAESRNRLHGT